MALILADQGAVQILQAYFNNSWPASKDLVVKLYCNNYTPVDSSTTSNFTEAAGGGYVTKTLTNGSWSESNVGGIEQEAYAQLTWTFTGPLTTNPTIYGYFVVGNNGTGNLVWAELLGATFTPNNNGDQLLITPVFQMSKGTPT